MIYGLRRVLKIEGLRKMGERYWITGVQIGMLLIANTQKERNKILKEIEDNQFISNYPTDKDKELFKRWLKEAPCVAWP